MSNKKNKKEKDKQSDIDLSDPLDKNATKNNFLTETKYSKEYKELSKKWSELPIYKHKKEIANIFKSFEKNQVTLIVSGTGSGKTVLVPKFLLKYIWETKTENKESTKIVITNPKTLTTIYNAEYSAKTLDVELGTHVGFKFRGSPANMISDQSKLIYATDGLLLAQINKGDLLLKEYDGVIIDEAHERQVPIDLLLYFFKHILKNRPEFKLIIMSATIDAEIFKQFYEKDDIKFGLVNVSGESNYPIESIYMKPNDKINLFNYMEIGISTILKILDTTDKGDILMFVTSQKETEQGCMKLKKLCPDKVSITDKCDQYYCAEVYAKMTDENRNLAIDKDAYKTLNDKYKRKVIFATNVAESSITMDGIIYVVDTGLEFISHFDYDRFAYVLDKRYITKAQIKQRMGRAGRTQNGVCYHLYTENNYNKLIDYPSPAIVLTNLTEHFLSFIKNANYLSDAIKITLNLITPATKKQIICAIRYLHFYNLIKLITLKNTDNQSGGNKKKIKCNKSNKRCISKIDSVSYFLYKNKQGGADIDTNDYDYIDNVNAINTEKEDETNIIQFSQIPYEKMLSDDSRNVLYSFDVLLQTYEGTTTTFGNIIHSLSGYPMELTMLAFYGRLLNIPSLYTIASIIAASDGKIENLINFPSTIQLKDRRTYINETFPEAITNEYSEHIFVYNLVAYYFEKDNKLELLNKTTYEKSLDIKATFMKILDKVKDYNIDNINKKYKLIPDNINLDNMNIIDKIYLGIYLSHKFNSLKLLDNNQYQTQYYFDQTQIIPSFFYGNDLTNNITDNYKFGVCYNISYLITKPIMNICTLLPNTLTNIFIN